MRILLSGYYGFDNAGDDAVLFAIVQALREMVKDAEITVLSNQPEKTAKEFGVNAVNRWGKKEIFRAVRNCDVLISGGGSLLQDVTSKNGILYYLGIIYLAQKLKKPVLIYAQGIGPVIYKRNRKLCGRILNKVSAITVRDGDSCKVLSAMNVKRPMDVVVDPVLGIDGENIDKALGETILAKAGWQKNGGKTLMVALRPWTGSENYIREVALCCDHFSARGWQVVFLPMHYGEDESIGKRTAEIMRQKAIVLTENYSPIETMALLKSSDLVLGMRLHALIMASIFQKPMVALSYDPKINSFMTNCGDHYCYSVQSSDSAELIKGLESSYKAVQEVNGKKTAYLSSANQWARQPAKIAGELLKQKV